MANPNYIRKPRKVKIIIEADIDHYGDIVRIVTAVKCGRGPNMKPGILDPPRTSERKEMIRNTFDLEAYRLAGATGTRKVVE